VISRFLAGLRDFLKGFLFANLWSHFHAEKRCFENFFMLTVFGSVVGVPHLFNFYCLRLVPYYMEGFTAWKKRMVKERDFFDQVGE